MYAAVLDAALVGHAHEPACVEVRSAAQRPTFAAFGFACVCQRLRWGSPTGWCAAGCAGVPRAHGDRVSRAHRWAGACRPPTHARTRTHTHTRAAVRARWIPPGFSRRRGRTGLRCRTRCAWRSRGRCSSPSSGRCGSHTAPSRALAHARAMPSCLTRAARGAVGRRRGLCGRRRLRRAAGARHAHRDARVRAAPGPVGPLPLARVSHWARSHLGMSVRRCAAPSAASCCAALRTRTCVRRRGLDVLIGCLASHKLASEIAVAGCETLGARHIGRR